MEIIVNGDKKQLLTPPENLAAFLVDLEGITPQVVGVAVALNEQVVPKQQWATTSLQEADVVEIVRAFQGG